MLPVLKCFFFGLKECKKISENKAQAAVLKKMVDHEYEVIHELSIFQTSLSFNIS